MLDSIKEKIDSSFCNHNWGECKENYCMPEEEGKDGPHVCSRDKDHFGFHVCGFCFTHHHEGGE